MSIFKCKMCGGTLEINEGQRIAVCEYCGTKQTLPKLDSDRRTQMYDRANHFRRNNEYDKAMGIYEKILEEDTSDSEAYWSIVLCRYGIEYVEDPSTHKRMPTVNRTQLTSIFADPDYQAAIKYADSVQREIYAAEAATIDEIQKGILEISQKEETFDVFICFKETDKNGKRTVDSVLANELYHELTSEGYKVFYAPITMENKLGTAYEPYIFAALNSAKVMVVLGTKPEHFNAVWVKNEWSRYLSLIKGGAKKTLIPAFRDMDPYDLPEEFSYLQAQDMSKLGFMQDLIRGISKLIDKPTEPESSYASSVPQETNVNGLIDHAMLLIEDKEYGKADECLEKALNISPKNPLIYIGKLLIERNLTEQSDLPNCDLPLESSGNYKKAARFADEELKSTLIEYNQTIINRNEEMRKNSTYSQANEKMESAILASEYEAAKELFDSIAGYRDADVLSAKCRDKAELLHKKEKYDQAINEYSNSKSSSSLKQQIAVIERSLQLLKEIPEYTDAAQKVTEFSREIEGLTSKYQSKSKRTKKTLIFAFSSATILTCVILLSYYVFIPMGRYNKAQSLYEEGKFDESIAIFIELSDYKDCLEKTTEVKYSQAMSFLDNGNYEEAIDAFTELGNYNDSSKMIDEVKYEQASDLLDKQDYKAAFEIFGELPGSSSGEKYSESGYHYAVELASSGDYDAAIEILKRVGEYDDSEALLNSYCLSSATEHYEAGEYEDALKYYTEINDYDKTSEMYLESLYQVTLNDRNYKRAAETFGNELKGYKDSDSQRLEFMYKYATSWGQTNSLTMYNFLKELALNGYKNSKELFDSIYSWNADIIVNDSESDTKTDMSSLSRYDMFYFHITLLGGEPGEMTCLRAVGHFPDGSSSTVNFDGNWASGWTGWCYFYYNNPSFAPLGTFTLDLYDGNGNLIATKDVRITS